MAKNMHVPLETAVFAFFSVREFSIKCVGPFSVNLDYVAKITVDYNVVQDSCKPNIVLDVLVLNCTIVIVNYILLLLTTPYL